MKRVLTLALAGLMFSACIGVSQDRGPDKLPPNWEELEHLVIFRSDEDGPRYFRGYMGPGVLEGQEKVPPVPDGCLVYHDEDVDRSARCEVKNQRFERAGAPDMPWAVYVRINWTMWRNSNREFVIVAFDGNWQPTAASGVRPTEPHPE